MPFFFSSFFKQIPATCIKQQAAVEFIQMIQKQYLIIP